MGNNTTSKTVSATRTKNTKSIKNKCVNADIIRSIVELDPSLANGLIRSCKTFKHWILDHSQTRNMLTEAYTKKWESEIQKQLLLFFKPNIRELYKPITQNNGMAGAFLYPNAPAFDNTLPVSIEYISLSKDIGGYNPIKGVSIEIGWNIAGYLLPEYRDLEWFNIVLNNSSHNFILGLIEIYSAKYQDSLFIQQQNSHVQTPTNDIINNLASVRNYTINTFAQLPSRQQPLQTIPESLKYTHDDEIIFSQMDETIEPYTHYTPTPQVPFDETMYETWGEHKQRYHFASIIGVATGVGIVMSVLKYFNLLSLSDLAIAKIIWGIYGMYGCALGMIAATFFAGIKFKIGP